VIIGRKRKTTEREREGLYYASICPQGKETFKVWISRQSILGHLKKGRDWGGDVTSEIHIRVGHEDQKSSRTHGACSWSLGLSFANINPRKKNSGEDVDPELNKTFRR